MLQLNNSWWSNLINQTKRPGCTIQHYLSSSRNKNIQTYVMLFDYQIKPNMLNASEAWGGGGGGGPPDVKHGLIL